MNPYAERLIGTLSRECLDHVIVLSQGHAQRLLAEFADYYNAERPHQALNGDRPVRSLRLVGKGPIVAQPHLGGLHHSYRRAA